MKKFLTYSVVVATIAWSLGISAVLPAAAAYTATDGDIIKTATYSAVYYVYGGKKYLFVNRATFGTWKDNFDGLKVVSQSDFDSLPLGGNVTARPGVSLVKFDNSSAVYAVTPGAVLVKISDSAALTALYGSASPIVIQSSFEANYTKASASLTATSNYPDGSLVSNSGNTYVVDGGVLRTVSSDAFTANGFKSSWVHAITNVSNYTVGSALTSKESKFADIVYGSGSSTTTVTGSVSVALSSDTPASGTIVAGQAIADLAHFTFTGTGTVTSLKLKRIGVSSDDRLQNVYLYDGNTKLTDAGYMSNGYVTFSNASGLFTVSGSRVISVKADLDSTNVTQTVGMSINAASDISGVSVGGSFPVNGNLMNYVYASDLATATFSNIYPSTSTNTSIDAGTTNQSLWSANLQVSQRSVYLKYVSFKQVGSISTSDLQNLGLYVAGTKVASGYLNSSNNLIFDLTSSPITLTTGSRSIEVRGDIAGGSNKEFSFQIQNASDIVLTDSSYGVNIATTVSNTLGGTFAIGYASIVLSTDSSFSSTQIVDDSTNVVLDQYTIQAYGEAAKIYTAVVSSTIYGASSGDKINNVSLYLDGSQVGSSQTATFGPSTSTTQSLTFGSGNLFTLAADGKSHVLQIRGDLDLVSGSAATAVGVALDLGTVQGMTSYKTTSVDNNQGNADLTVVAGALNVVKTPTYYDQTIAPNTTNVKVGSFTLTAGDADSVRITNLNVNFNGSGVAAGRYLSNLYLAYDSNTTSKIGSPSATADNNFSVDFTLAKNTSKVIDVYADLGNPSTVTSSIATLGGIAAGSSGSTVTFSDTTGQTITVSSGALYTSGISKTSNSLSSQYVIGGSTVNMMILNFLATSTAVTIDELGFNFGGTAAAAGKTPVTSVTVNGITKTVSSNTATTTLTGLNLTIPAGYAGLDVPVAATYGTVGLNAMDAGYTATSSLIYVKYKVGNTTGYLYPSVASNGVLLVSTKPTVALSKPSVTLSDGTNLVAKIVVSADTAGKIVLKDLPLNISTSNAVFTSTSNSLIVKVDGGTIDTENTAFSSGSTTLSFKKDSSYTNYSVAAGSSVTLDIYVQGVALSGSNSADSRITTKLGTAANFTWVDVGGNNKDVSGSYYNNWSSDTVSVTD